MEIKDRRSSSMIDAVDDADATDVKENIEPPVEVLDVPPAPTTEDTAAATDPHLNALPVCPHCGQDPANIASRPLQMQNFKCLVIFCGNIDCRKMFGIEVIGMDQQVAPVQRMPFYKRRPS